MRHIGETSDLDVITGLQAESPGMFAIVVHRGAGNGAEHSDSDGKHRPQEADGSFLGKWTSADRDALLRPQKWRFLLRVQVEQASVVNIFARRFVGRGVQLLLDGGTALSRHQQVSCRGNR